MATRQPTVAAILVVGCVFSLAAGGAAISMQQASMLFAGFNDVLGPIITNTPFDDPTLLTLTERLHVGALRHPGGTVANYWSLVNGTYSTPCRNPELPILGDRCKYADAIAQNGLPRPRDRFTPDNFVRGVGSATGSRWLPVVFDLNLLTLSDADTIAQLDALEPVVAAASRRGQTVMIELGNELFYSLFYSPVVPNASAYVSRIRPLVREIRRRYGGSTNVSIAVVSNPLGGIISDERWDDTLSAELRADPDLRYAIDAVTIHDYACNADVAAPGNFDAAAEELALWGPRQVPSLLRYVRDHYDANGTDRTPPWRPQVWMTEFNTGVAAHEALVATNNTYSAVHSLFAVNYAIAALCDAAGRWDVLLLHMLWQQPGMTSSPLVWLDTWGVAQIPRYPRTDPAPLAHATWTTMAQITAHIGSWMGAGDGAATCLAAETTDDCLRGVAFSIDGSASTFVVTNGCRNTTNVTRRDFEIAVMPAALQNRTVEVWTYRHWMGVGGGSSSLADCSASLPLWRCGPASPEDATFALPADATSVTVSIPSIAIAIVRVT